jgi:hypothetical protein
MMLASLIRMNLRSIRFAVMRRQAAMSTGFPTKPQTSRCSQWLF